jgi:hypothetical protein
MATASTGVSRTWNVPRGTSAIYGTPSACGRRRDAADRKTAAPTRRAAPTRSVALATARSMGVWLGSPARSSMPDTRASKSPRPPEVLLADPAHLRTRVRTGAVRQLQPAPAPAAKVDRGEQPAPPRPVPAPLDGEQRHFGSRAVSGNTALSRSPQRFHARGSCQVRARPSSCRGVVGAGGGTP